MDPLDRIPQEWQDQILRAWTVFGAARRVASRVDDVPGQINNPEFEKKIKRGAGGKFEEKPDIRGTIPEEKEARASLPPVVTEQQLAAAAALLTDRQQPRVPHFYRDPVLVQHMVGQWLSMMKQRTEHPFPDMSSIDLPLWATDTGWAKNLVAEQLSDDLADVPFETLARAARVHSAWADRWGRNTADVRAPSARKIDEQFTESFMKRNSALPQRDPDNDWNDDWLRGISEWSLGEIDYEEIRGASAGALIMDHATGNVYYAEAEPTQEMLAWMNPDPTKPRYTRAQAGTPEAETMLRDSMVAAVVQSWAYSSNANPLSSAVQKVAERDSRDVQLSHPAADFPPVTEGAEQYLQQPDAEGFVQRYLQAQRERTAAFLSSLGIDRVEVYRGMSVHSDWVDEALGAGSIVPMRESMATEGPVAAQVSPVTRPLSSWAVDPAEAHIFLSHLESIMWSEGGYGALLRSTVGLEGILSTPLTGVGAWNEAEVVLQAAMRRTDAVFALNTVELERIMALLASVAPPLDIDRETVNSDWIKVVQSLLNGRR